MKYLKLRIANYRGVVSSEIEFDSLGLTLVQGPNEVGKTSLGEAIGILFKYFDSSKHKAVVAICPVHRDEGPEIELEAESGPYRFTYTKRFHKKSETRLTITAPKSENHTGREAHDRAWQILRETLDINLWKALTIQQGEAIDQPNLADQTSLSAALDKAAGGVTTEQAEEGLFEKVVQEYGQSFTPTGQEKKNIKDARERNKTAAADVSGIEADLRSLDNDVERDESLQKELEKLKDREVKLTEEFENHQKSLGEIKTIESLVREAKLKLESAETSQTLAVNAKEERENLIKLVEQTSEEYGRFIKSSKDWMSPIEQAKAEFQATKLAFEQADQKRKTADALAKIRRDDFDYYNNLLYLEQFRERKTRIDKARTSAAHAEETLANNRVDEKVLKGIEMAERDLLAVKTRRETAAPSVKLTGLNHCDVRINSDDTVIENEEVREFSVPNSMRIVIPDQIEIEIAAGSSIDKLTQEVSQTQAAIDAACREAGVDNPDSARAASKARKGALEEIARKDQTEQDNLRDLSYDDLSEKLLQLGQTVPDYLVGRSSDPAIVADLDAAEVERGNAEKSQEVCHEEWETAHQLVGTAQNVRDQLSSKNEAARVNLNCLKRDLGRLTESLDDSRKSKSDETIERYWQQAKQVVEGEQTNVSKADNSLRAKNPEQIKALAESTQGSLTTTKNRREVARIELAQVQTRLKIHGEDGLYEKLQAAKTKRESVTSEYHALSRRATAAKLLYDIMKRERDNARRAYVAPLKDKVERLGRLVFDQEFQVELDENLQILARTHNGVTVPFDSLSGGTKEQLSLIFRLACSMIVAEEGGMPLIMDDALGYTDPERLRFMGAILAKAAKECQIVIFTCVPDRYSHIGKAKVVSLHAG